MTRILHLTDTHVSATGPDVHEVDAVDALARMLHDARHVPDLDLVVVSGDLTDDGSARGCAMVREQVGAFARERGVPQVYCTGNHDDRGAFRAVLGSGHLGPDGRDRGRLLAGPAGPASPRAADASAPCAAISHSDGLRIITLDSLVAGEVAGRLGEAQLGSLAAELSGPAPGGTVLVVHHPPLPLLPAAPVIARLGLHDTGALAEVVRGTDVRAILAGHFHFQAAGLLAGIPVWVTPAVVTRIDTTAPRHRIRGVEGPSAAVVDILPGQGPTYHLLSGRRSRPDHEVFVYDAATLERLV